MENLTISRIEKIAKEAFSSMPNLYDKDDIIHVVDRDKLKCFDVEYYSNRYSDKRLIKYNMDKDFLSHLFDALMNNADINPWNITFYALQIEKSTQFREQNIHYENLVVHPEYRNRGFATEIVQAKHRILKQIGFEFSPVVDMNSRSEAFWRKMGYVEGSRVGSSAEFAFKL